MADSCRQFEYVEGWGCACVLKLALRLREKELEHLKAELEHLKPNWAARVAFAYEIAGRPWCDQCGGLHWPTHCDFLSKACRRLNKDLLKAEAENVELKQKISLLLSRANAIIALGKRVRGGSGVSEVSFEKEAKSLLQLE